MEESTVQTYDDDIRDQPVDYSKKYLERNRLKQNCLLNNTRKSRSSREERESKTVLFGDYAETDLDQPTDYSLRYAEDDTDEDEKPSTEYFHGSVQEDTVKTYCTEGTPYETPFNFSTATSMSDLRVEDTKDTDISKKLNKKAIEIRNKKDVLFEDRNSRECQQDLIVEDTERQKQIINLNPSPTDSKKQINYYKEEESSSSSCVNSLSSFNSEVAQQNIPEMMMKVTLEDSINKSEPERNDPNTRINSTELIASPINDSPMEMKNTSRIVDKEGKVVTFSGQDYYTEQTPLMFSRCSSLGSLSGFEQHSIHDDRSSVVSDFSRRTSGLISPSELPDSPTQTIPPSPRISKTQSTNFIAKIQEEAVKPTHSHLLCTKYMIKRSSVFEDDIATFKEESTPIEFSAATSLSSLTIDDEVKGFEYSKSQDKSEENSQSLEKNDDKSQSFIKVHSTEHVDKEPEQVSDGDEDDEDMLAACISMGIQNNRYRQSLKTDNIQKSAHSKSGNILIPCERKSPLNRSELRISVSPRESPTTSKICKPPMEIVVVPDTVHVYCTEDTPAGISPVGSQSNLSVLSMPSVLEDIEKIEPMKAEVESQRNDLSDESYNLSDEDEKILDECIQSGIPKVRQITPPPTKSIPCVNNSESLPQKFSICGTPSSSPVESNPNNKNPVLSKTLCHISLEHDKEDFSDDSPNHSEDEAMLIECIQAAKARLKYSPSPLLKTTKTSKSPTTQHSSSLSRLQQTKLQQKKIKPQEHGTSSYQSIGMFYPTEDSYSPSEEEEDIILAQCIQSGMPKVLNVSTPTPVPSSKKRDLCLRSIGISSTSTTSFLNESYPINNLPLYAQLRYKGSNASRYPVGNSSSNYTNFPTKAFSSS